MTIRYSWFCPVFLTSASSNWFESLIKLIVEGPAIWLITAFILFVVFIAPYYWCLKQVRSGAHPLDDFRYKNKLTEKERFFLLEFYAFSGFASFISLVLSMVIAFVLYDIPFDTPNVLGSLWFSILVIYVVMTIAAVIICAIFSKVRSFFANKKSARDKQNSKTKSPPHKGSNRGKEATK